MMRRLSSILILFTIIGCEAAKTDSWQPENPTEARELADAMSEVSKNDLEIIYKQYSGITECLRHCDSCFEDTLDINETIGVFQNHYGYKNSRYENMSKAFLSYMNSRGYAKDEETRKIVDNVQDDKTEISRAKLIEDLQVIADGAKLALKAKNVDKH